MASLTVEFLPKPAYSQGACLGAVDAVKRDIEERVGAKILEISWLNETNSPVEGKKMGIAFRLASNGSGDSTDANHRAGDNITNSPALTRQYAERVISNCDKASHVYFPFYEWAIGWSLYPDNSLREDKCTDWPGERKWGEVSCL